MSRKGEIKEFSLIRLDFLSFTLLIALSIGFFAGCVPGFGGAGIPPTFTAPTIVVAKPTLILTYTSTPLSTQTPVPPTGTAPITPIPTETATKTPEPTKLPISACMSDFNKWEKAPAPPGEWGPIDKEKFRSQISDLNHLIADSGIVEEQMKAAGIKGKPFDQSVIYKSNLVMSEMVWKSSVYLQQGTDTSRPYGLYPGKRNMWPVCIWQMEVNGFKMLAISEALASTKSEKGYVVVTGLIAQPASDSDPVYWQRWLDRLMKATAQNGGSITPYYHFNFPLLRKDFPTDEAYGWFSALADATGYDGSFDQYAIMWGQGEDLPEAAEDTFFIGRLYDYGRNTR